MPIDLKDIHFFNPTSDPEIDWDHVDQQALEMLDAARQHADTPFKITSNYRTPEHSVAVGGLNGDAHTQSPCTAFDIAFSDTLQAHKIIEGCMIAGFPRIGINPFNHHVHVDSAPGLPTPRFWVETPDHLMIRALKARGFTVTSPLAPPSVNV